MNDIFRVVKGKDVRSVELRIYDRWGNQVFSTFDPKQGWDGRFKGKDMPTGTYFYVLTAYFNNDYQAAHKMYRGEIALIR